MTQEEKEKQREERRKLMKARACRLLPTPEAYETYAEVIEVLAHNLLLMGHREPGLSTNLVSTIISHNDYNT